MTWLQEAVKLVTADRCHVIFVPLASPSWSNKQKKKKIRPSLCRQLTNQCKGDNPFKLHLTKSKSTIISENSSVFVNLQPLGSNWSFGSPWTDWRAGLWQRGCFHWMASHKQRGHLIPRPRPRPQESTNKANQPRTYFRGSLQRLHSFLP